jgi:hypothetical protein
MGSFSVENIITRFESITVDRAAIERLVVPFGEIQDVSLAMKVELTIQLVRALWFG